MDLEGLIGTLECDFCQVIHDACTDAAGVESHESGKGGSEEVHIWVASGGREAEQMLLWLTIPGIFLASLYDFQDHR